MSLRGLRFLLQRRRLRMVKQAQAGGVGALDEDDYLLLQENAADVNVDDVAGAVDSSYYR